MLVQHIALVPETEELSAAELARVCAALQTQVTRDFSPAWGIQATVDAFPDLDEVPIGYRPIIVTSRESNAQAGVGIDHDGQPYAQIQLSPYWSLDASRACLELLVNPFGTRTVTAQSLRSDQGAVDFLVEVCGSCGDAAYAYAIHDVLVSDFCTPRFFAQMSLGQSERYSANGSVRAAFELLPGGQLTWYDLSSGSWWARNHWADTPTDVCFDAFVRGTGVMRDVFYRPRRLASSLRATDAFRARVAARSAQSERAARLRALRLRSLVKREPEVIAIEPEAIAIEPLRAPKTLPPPLPAATMPPPAPVRSERVRARSSLPPSLIEPEPATKSRPARMPSTAPAVISVPPASAAPQTSQRWLMAAMVALCGASLAIGAFATMRGSDAADASRSAAPLHSAAARPSASPVAAAPATPVASAATVAEPSAPEPSKQTARLASSSARRARSASPETRSTIAESPPPPATTLVPSAAPAPPTSPPVLRVTPAPVAASHLDSLIETRR